MKKKTVFSLSGIVSVIVLIIVFLALYNGEDIDIYIDDKKITVEGDEYNDRYYIFAEDLLDEMGISYEKSEKGIKTDNSNLLDIDIIAEEVRVSGEAAPYEVMIKDNKILIPSSLVGEIADGTTEISDHKIYVVKPDKINATLRGGEVSFEYSDDFFIQEAFEYNHPLAKASLAVASAAFSAKEADIYWGDEGNLDREKNIVEIYRNLGFSNIKTYNYDKSLNDKNNKVAFVIAEKMADINNKKSRLIAVAARGGVYGNEWVSNFNLGNGENHKGFSLSAQGVTEKIEKYIGDNIKETKLWITGFSRGGAVVNLVAAQMGDANKIGTKNIYAYTFASPRVTLSDKAKDKRYNYIYNIISENDLVPYVAPKEWGYERYGRDVILPYLSDYNVKTAEVQERRIENIYAELKMGKKLNFVHIEELNQSQQVRTAIENLCTAINNKEKYVKHYEKILMDFIECKNTKIKNSDDEWNAPPFDKGILNKYKSEGEELLNRIRRADFLENLDQELGNTRDTLYYFGAACLKFGKDPYKVMTEDIGIENLLGIAGLFYSDSEGDINIAKMHTPESYIAQILAINNPDYLTIKEEL